MPQYQSLMYQPKARLTRQQTFVCGLDLDDLRYILLEEVHALLEATRTHHCSEV